jgi:TolB-like protein
VVALCLLFGGAGVYVLLTGGRAPGFGPVEAGADEAATGIAIVPFNVTGGTELGLWREGMVDVLSTNLDGMGGYRTIDSRTVMARWRERVGDEATPDLQTSLEVAGSTGARYGLMGNLVGNPGGVRINADIYDLSTGDKITQSYVEGAADSVLALVGRLSVGLTRDLLAATGQQLIQAPRTAGITTTSLEALRHYLDGQAAYRRADFATAAAAFERAVDADSMFVMAWHGLSDAYGWMENINSEVGGRASERVVALADLLPLRERTLMVAAERGLDEGDLTALDDLREAVTKYLPAHRDPRRAGHGGGRGPSHPEGRGTRSHLRALLHPLHRGACRSRGRGWRPRGARNVSLARTDQREQPPGSGRVPVPG